MIRKPVVAGQFYSGSKEALEREVQALVDSKADKEDAIGVVSPHAGYAYSGPVAGSVLSAI
ncbi:MAG: AmmeMemoRadiSam system protein B, partial [Candidatus Omnitrophica bacterium]|nr:AmmeMemoRadiSam system protein B [Candidatus Omnitrophota bacterium]